MAVAVAWAGIAVWAEVPTGYLSVKMALKNQISREPGVEGVKVSIVAAVKLKAGLKRSSSV